MSEVLVYIHGFEVKPGPKPKLHCMKCGKPAKYRNDAYGCFILACECKK